jgi:hypothetical protein
MSNYGRALRQPAVAAVELTLAEQNALSFAVGALLVHQVDPELGRTVQGTIARHREVLEGLIARSTQH